METYSTGVTLVDIILIDHLEKILNPNKSRALTYNIFLICNNIIVGFGNTNIHNYRLLISAVEKFIKEIENESS